MDPKELFAKSVSQATGCLGHLDSRQLDNLTPCNQWSVKTLLNHMVYELHCVADTLSGKTVKPVSNRHDGHWLGTDAKAAWQHAADAALMAVKHTDPEKIVSTPYGEIAAKHYIAEVSGDILVHTWDLEQGMNCTLMIEPKLARTVYDYILPRTPDLMESGLFDAPLNIPKGATIQAKLLGLFGRRMPKPS